jgi:hypothetical protein
VVAPAYLALLPADTPPTNDLWEFLDLLAQRMGMIKRGGVRDITRAATYFVRWWREEGGLLSAAAPLVISPDEGRGLSLRRGWGFDLEWTPDDPVHGLDPPSIQQRFENCIDEFAAAAEAEEAEGGGSSGTQEKKVAREEFLAVRAAKAKAKYLSKGANLKPRRSRR